MLGCKHGQTNQRISARRDEEKANNTENGRKRKSRNDQQTIYEHPNRYGRNQEYYTDGFESPSGSNKNTIHHRNTHPTQKVYVNMPIDET